MYIDVVPNRNSSPAVLLRESYREGKRIRKRTIANLTQLPAHVIEGIKALLKGGSVTGQPLEKSFEIARSLPHGHVVAVLQTMRTIGLDSIIEPEQTRQRDLVVAMITARILDPGSKLATVRGLSPETATSSLHDVLGIGRTDEDELYSAMDWLLERQQRIQKALAGRHMSKGSLVLYDVTSTYFEGQRCPLARIGYSRDDKFDHLQIVFGLLCNAEGCPVAVEVFEGNTSDALTLRSQIEKVQKEFALDRVIIVGDRGMITDARIDEDMRGRQGLHWITALRFSAIRTLMTDGTLQLTLFDERDMAQITHPDYPGERLIACRNPFMAEHRARVREELLCATEKELDKIVEATGRLTRPLRGKDKIGVRVGKVIGKYKVGKHFQITITDSAFSYKRDTAGIEEEAAMDGIYVIRTSVPADVMDAEASVGAYKRLAVVERAFRSYKTVDLKVRPIYHHLADRVRAHVLLCMLAYYVEWHMRQSLAPVLFDDDAKEETPQLRDSIVAPAKRSPKALRKARRKRTDEDLPVHSFQTLLKDLATITKNTIVPKIKGAQSFSMVTRPTAFQEKVLELLGIHL
ncbi:MAG: IS1634 family transposase [Dissulfurispiraceae bacterium]